MERFNKCLKEGLKTNLSEGMTFADSVRTILQNYRATPHALTQKSPSQLMLNRQMRLPLDKLKPPTTSFGNAQTDMKSEIEQRQAKIKSYTDQRRHARSTNLNVGDWVRVKRPNCSHKLSSTFSEPHRIVMKLGKSSFRLDNGTAWSARRCVRSHRPDSFVLPPELPSEHLMMNPEHHPVVTNANSLPTHESRPVRITVMPAYLRDYVLS
ncbi:uncharacterized protein LOC144359904 [Saccoglossus kowalevskii]